MPTPLPCSSSRMPESATADALAALAGPDRSAAWDRLVHWHGLEVWRLIRSRIADPATAEDAYQDFWIRLPQTAVRYAPDAAGGERSARAWLMRVAYTMALNRARDTRVQRRRLLPISGVAEEAAMDGPVSAYTQEQVAQVRVAMDALAERHRRPLLLRLVAGLSYEELAIDLGCSVNAARVKVHRALELLRERLGSDERRMPETALAGLLLPILLPPPSLPPLPAAMPLAAGAGGVAAKVWLIAGGVVLAGAATAVVVESGRSQAVAAPAVELDGFERDEPGMGAGAERPCELSIIPAPADGGSGRVLRMAWPSVHASWLDAGYQRTRTFPSAIVGAAEAVLQVRLPDDDAVRYLAVRCNDAHGETFEWRSAAFAPGTAGWRSVRIAIDPAHPDGHWDGDPGDGIVDLPLSLLGYAVVLRDAGVGAGAVLFDAVGIAPSASPP